MTYAQYAGLLLIYCGIDNWRHQLQTPAGQSGKDCGWYFTVEVCHLRDPDTNDFHIFDDKIWQNFHDHDHNQDLISSFYTKLHDIILH